MRPVGSRRPVAWAVAAVAVALGCTRTSASPPGPAPVRAAVPEEAGWSAVPDTSGMTRIRFARGTTSGIVSDSLPAGGEHTYLLGALQGQVMLAHAIAWTDPGEREPQTTVRVYRTDGVELSAPGGVGSLWTGRLPGTGDYIVRVRATSGPTPYTLAVQIPLRVVVDRENPSGSYSGLAPSRAPVDYVIKGERGQALAVDLRSERPGTQLHVYGLDDGIQLARLTDRLQRWSGRLPATQDYVVSVVPAGEETSYELLVTLR